MTAAPFVVQKLGGAQARGPWLRRWLDAIAAQPGRVVVAPGGGPFADAVRAAQALVGYDDEAASSMARRGRRRSGRICWRRGLRARVWRA